MLEARAIGKSYGGPLVLAGANLTVRAGSVHALLGQNGAGKSTLVKVIAGVVQPDAGELLLSGEPVHFSSAADAIRAGISVVSQELNLFEDLDVLANLYPLREPRRGPFISRREMDAQARPVLAELGLKVDGRTLVRELSLAQRQLLEIARALLTRPRVLVLDEPTSALESASTENLFAILRVLREREVAVVFVSHMLEEVMSLCDELTVLRDGRPVITAMSREQATIETLVQAMLGDEHAGRLGRGAVPRRDGGTGRLPVRSARGELAFEGVSLEGRLRDVSLRAAPGEIVGLAGVAGSGHMAVLELLAGICRPDAGRVLLPGGRRVPRGLRAAIGAGVALVTGDRRRLGLMLDKSIWENATEVRSVSLAADGLLVRAARLRTRAREHVRRLGIRATSVEERAGALSGGNQQKLVFAKWLDANPSVFLLDDPTRGVDVGAKAEMHGLIRAAANGGAVVVMCSTELPELAGLCDRVVVLRHGELCAELAGDALSEHSIATTMHAGAQPV